MQRTFLLIFLIGLMLASCDDFDTTDSDERVPLLYSLEVSPDSVSFETTDSLIDTTIAFQLQLSADQVNTSPIHYTVSKADEEVVGGQFNEGQTSGLFDASFELELSTIEFSTYRIYAYAYNAAGQGEWIETSVDVRGFSGEPPVVEWAENPDEVQLPESGNKSIRFEAMVVHPIDQSLIQSVNFFLVDSNDIKIAELQMYDDGITNPEEGRDDQEADDMIYTRLLFINPDNQPDEYTVFYYALDQTGLSSDTLQTTLNIIE